MTKSEEREELKKAMDRFEGEIRKLPAEEGITVNGTRFHFGGPQYLTKGEEDGIRKKRKRDRRGVLGYRESAEEVTDPTKKKFAFKQRSINLRKLWGHKILAEENRKDWATQLSRWK